MSDSFFEEYITSLEKLELLKFLTCGSVDDGKSTLIGRILNDTGSIYIDELKALDRVSKEKGTQKGKTDYALLLDGLMSEQEQGITIDVAYKYFATKKRKFIVADTPGHEEYTRNMVTGSSIADLAIILVDAEIGISKQTLRHTNICDFMGINKIILAINKMDLINYNEKKYLKIKEQYLSICDNCNFKSVYPIPLSALKGENIKSKSKLMHWYTGLPIIRYLETIKIDPKKGHELLLPIQLINRPNPKFRGFCGLIASGTIKKNDKIYVLPSMTKSSVSQIFVGDKSVDEAITNQNVTLTFNDQVSVSRGDLIVKDKDHVFIEDQFDANIIWLSKDDGYIGREYILKLSSQTTLVYITSIKHKLDIENNKKLAAKKISVNNIYKLIIKSKTPIWFKKFLHNKTLGSFLLVDTNSNETIAAGTINHNLTRSSNLIVQNFTINKELRRLKNKHQSKVFWLTGLSGSGKSTIANNFENFLHTMCINSYILDGDNIRQGLNSDLGFTEEDRIENIRRIAEVSRLFVDAGIITIVSFISPFKEDRDMARKLFADGDFIEVFINTSLEVCEKRDVKGLYKKARKGEIKNFTGINSRYEPPINPEVIVDTEKMSIEKIVDILKSFI